MKREAGVDSIVFAVGSFCQRLALSCVFSRGKTKFAALFTLVTKLDCIVIDAKSVQDGISHLVALV